ncbi:phosphonate ABC transporter periplasmic phosphonate-binding protein [Natronococcus amylolyticus DSM 10524]|uniref:Phosphonate ABC transporter periplasmic phosphonate-binding protein n=1 Tax=Natronococcus amylolyticus DSM 10524 TaxID=1227497 RepID=L9X7D4_9EURY|nr:phosphonate ABC transporter periplasmic phosphonate-binding protein [Natronococcus amylolyticus DSM 10524]
MLTTTAGVTAAGLAGCLGNDDGSEGQGNDDDYGNPDVSDEFVFAIEARDDPADIERDWEPLAEWIESETGVPTSIDTVPDDGAAIGALATGQAHASYLSGGPSWVGWNEHGFETLAVEADEDGQPYYVAAAYTRSDTGIETMRDAEGVDSAHTGDLTGAGMLVPTAYLAEEGLVEFDDDDDVTAIHEAVEEYFGNPVVGGGYVGALQALSEEQADIAFGRATTPEEYCGGDDAEEWCLDLDEYEIVEEFTQVPSHPVLASLEATDAEKELLEEALLALNDDPDGQEILEDVFDVHELQEATSEEHLGPYGELISNLPGIEDHLIE